MYCPSIEELNTSIWTFKKTSSAYRKSFFFRICIFHPLSKLHNSTLDFPDTILRKSFFLIRRQFNHAIEQLIHFQLELLRNCRQYSIHKICLFSNVYCQFIRQFLRSTFECFVTIFSKCLFFGRYVYHSPSNLYTFILDNIFRKYWRFICHPMKNLWTFSLNLQKSPYLDKLFFSQKCVCLNCSEIIFMKYSLVVKIVIQLCVVRIHTFNYQQKYFWSSRKSKLLHQWPKEEKGHLAWTEQLLRER